MGSRNESNVNLFITRWKKILFEQWSRRAKKPIRINFPIARKERHRKSYKSGIAEKKRATSVAFCSLEREEWISMEKSSEPICSHSTNVDEEKTWTGEKRFFFPYLTLWCSNKCCVSICPLTQFASYVDANWSSYVRTIKNKSKLVYLFPWSLLGIFAFLCYFNRLVIYYIYYNINISFL